MALLAWTCLFAANAHAQPAQADRVSGAAEQIVAEHLRKLGAVVEGDPTRMFLQQGDSQVLAQKVESGCVGFLAFGTGDVRDVDLSIHTEGGLSLEEDASAAPYAYVRGCAGRPQTWFVNVSLYAGRGELMLVRLAQAPQSVGLLPFELGLAAPSGGRPERPRSVGPSPPRLSAEQRVLAEEAEWARRGYAAGTGVVELPLEAGLGRASVPLEAGLCYALVVTSAVSRHTAVIIAGPEESRWTGSAPEAEAVVYACPRTTDVHTVFVRAQPGGSTAWMRAYVQVEARRWDPGMQRSDRARSLVGELTFAFEQRGLASEVLGQGWVDTVGPLHWPVPMQRGRCYGLGAVALDGPQRGSVELALESPEGHLESRHRRRDGPPYVYHCAQETGVHRLVIRATGEVGLVAVVRGERDLAERGSHARRF